MIKSISGVFGLLIMFLAHAAVAGPALFSANLQQVGGHVQTTNWYQTSTGPTAGNPDVAEITSMGGFEFPALAFNRETTGYNFTLPPVYPYILARITLKNQAGTVAPDYLTATYTRPATNVLEPYASVTPRAGWMRFAPGSQGMGGVVPFPLTKNYIFSVQTSLGLLRAKAFMSQYGYYAPLGFSMGKVVNANHAGITYSHAQWTQPGGPTAYYSIGLIGSGGPWITGMITVGDGGAGPVFTTTTQTGADSRSAFDTGAVSLVTPRIQNVYQNDGSNNGNASVINLRDGYGIVHQLSIDFLPEPTQVAMMFTGLLGLLGLGRLRRR